MSHEQLPLDRIAAIAMALGRGLVAFAEVLGASAAVVPMASPQDAPPTSAAPTVSTPPAPAPAAPPAAPPATPSASPAPPPATDPTTAALLDTLKTALATPSPSTTGRKRRAIVPKRHRPDHLGFDYQDELGEKYLSQRGAAERLNVSPTYIARIEEQGRLVRHMVEGKVAYRVADIDGLVARLDAYQRAQAQAAAANGTAACAVGG